MLNWDHDHFRGDISRDQARMLFKKHVVTVECEISSYCNRVCSFCPNSFIDRRSDNKKMSDAVYGKILDDLADIGYSGAFSFHKYNEPLSDAEYAWQRISQAKSKLTNARLVIYTNGDYVNLDLLQKFCLLGIQSIVISVYLGNEYQYTNENMEKAFVQRMKRYGINLPYRTGKGVICAEGIMHAAGNSCGMQITLLCRDFDRVGGTLSKLDRGGAIATGEKFTRYTPCSDPFNKVTIEYDGGIYPCCNIRGDIPQHARYKLGSVGDGTDIFSVYASSKFAGWRRGMATFDIKGGPCSGCSSASIPDTEENRAYVKTLLKHVETRKALSV